MMYKISSKLYIHKYFSIIFFIFENKASKLRFLDHIINKKFLIIENIIKKLTILNYYF